MRRKLAETVERHLCLVDAIEMGIELEHEWEGIYTPHKVKGAVSGCPRNCSEASTKDIGLIAVEGGWQVRVGGAAGASVREGDVLATFETKGEAMADSHDIGPDIALAMASGNCIASRFGASSPMTSEP